MKHQAKAAHTAEEYKAEAIYPPCKKADSQQLNQCSHKKVGEIYNILQ